MLNAILSLLLSWLWHLLLIAARHRESFRRTTGGAGSSFGSLPPAQPNHDISAARRRHQSLHSCLSLFSLSAVIMPDSVAQWWNPIAAKLPFANGHSAYSQPKRVGSCLGLTFALHTKGLMRASSPCSRFYLHLPVHSIPLSHTFHSESTVYNV
ncbi:hypothetical protein BKA56DRAFT_711136 [Ilyonectria sp. MPI-CAGE-AT-0026]|nr:hypothetical protein BKA56DRAFT_711136 [Ilyonectria sp. MPI-CAGE-AT-0026]